MDLLPEIVAEFEAFSSKVYSCAAGKLTVGYGHVLKEGENFPEPISRQQGLFLLMGDLADAATSVDALFRGCLLTDYERDALISFAFNLGGHSLRDSTLRQRLLSNKRREAAAEFLRWVYAEDPDTHEKKKLPGLIRRRHCESVWFLGAAPATVRYLAGIKEEE